MAAPVCTANDQKNALPLQETQKLAACRQNNDLIFNLFNCDGVNSSNSAQEDEP
jgi:hypothetical protein